MPVPPSKWTQIITADPDHSYRYIRRFEMMAESGADLVGEARTIDAMVPRGARILDAGCGPGRHAGALAALGHHVVGVDGDPVLIDAARATHPAATFLVQDLAELDLPDQRFDAILCAGNVMGFLHPDTRVEVLSRFRRHLTDEGRAAIGFGAGRGYEFHEFFADIETAALRVDAAFSTWDLRPFTPESGFVVVLLSHLPQS